MAKLHLLYHYDDNPKYYTHGYLSNKGIVELWVHGSGFHNVIAIIINGVVLDNKETALLQLLIIEPN